MKYSQEFYQRLAEKWLNGTITPEEEKLFDEWYNENQDSPVVVTEELATDEDEHRRKIFEKIQYLTGERKTWRYRGLAVAAAVSFFMIAAGLFYSLPYEPSVVASYEYNLPPASDAEGGAILRLSDGSEVNLGELQTGHFLRHGEAEIKKSDDDVLEIFSAEELAGESQMNTLRVPNGVKYRVVLPDGTSVWMNSGSELRFPTKFSEQERTVALSGEAYFEVAKSTTPFRVDVGGLSVNVLGTHFNVMAYHDEGEIRTTLLEGSVRVSVGEANELLRPGEQAAFDKAGNAMVVRNANTEEAVAWMNGMFQFENTKIDVILRQIARRYNVGIVYVGQIPEKEYTGKIPHDTDLTKVFDIVRYMGFACTVEGDTVRIMERMAE